MRPPWPARSRRRFVELARSVGRYVRDDLDAAGLLPRAPRPACFSWASRACSLLLRALWLRRPAWTRAEPSAASVARAGCAARGAWTVSARSRACSASAARPARLLAAARSARRLDRREERRVLARELLVGLDGLRAVGLGRLLGRLRGLLGELAVCSAARVSLSWSSTRRAWAVASCCALRIVYEANAGGDDQQRQEADRGDDGDPLAARGPGRQREHRAPGRRAADRGARRGSGRATAWPPASPRRATRGPAA